MVARADAVPASATHGSPRPAARLLPWWNTALALGGAAALVLIGLKRRWVADETLVHLRTVRQFLAGNGLVLNAGERAEAFLSPLWQGLLLAGGAFTPDARLPQLAVVLGLLLAAAGLLLAVDGARVLHGHLLGRPLPMLPAGLLVLLALPPVWEFSAAGLDTGAVFLWTAGAWRLLVACRPQGHPGELFEAPQGRLVYLCAVVAGLGPLVRPELTLTSLVFVGALLWMLRPARRTALGLLGASLALPVSYEILRAGYYGLLLPLPAVAREATGVHHERGRLYFEDFIDSYWMLLPLVLLGGLGLIYSFADKLVAPRRTPLEATVLRQGRGSVLAAAPVLAGCLLALYVWRVGGDQLHARAALPALFTLLLPVMVLPVRRVLVTVVAALAVWAALSASPLRAPYDGGDGRFFDARAHMVQTTGDRHPDERTWSAAFPALGRAAHVPALWYFDAGPAQGNYRSLPLPSGAKRPVVAAGFAGAAGSAAPLDTVVADMWGAGDPLAAHLVPVMGWWPGQEKYLGNAWLFARYAAPATGLPGPDALTRYREEPAASPGSVAAARRALGCGRLAELRESTTAPLTAERFVRNLVGAAQRTRLRIPREPAVAVREFCPSKGTPALDPKNGHRPSATPVRDAPRTP
ncbi:membrane protein [Streptomyces spiroverticillatus]|uniref:Membrane protein n=1 Tax=Streptomyces finlayi TaxID=67296 RepID=A0A918X371_9ACTN|nr:hypothetical protein [Streptomyces finlayi]GGZ94877.1 membrane protein [Streptomyces spiroverticillatus]GHD07220.1 membrane protein [Streptomyces finlayi]